MALVLEERPTKNGRKYYYLNWFARVNGRTRRIKQIYIGTLERLAEKIEDPTSDVKLKSYSFGHIALFFNICEKLKLKEIFEECIQKKTKEITYNSLFLIILNRLDEPVSKNKVESWYRKSIVNLFIRLRNVSSQALWNQMNYIDDNEIVLIKTSLVENIQKEFIPNDERFNYDQTNFFTYCQQSELLRKGHNKKKRHDKNQVGVSLLIGQDSEIPYYYNAFPGNMHDSKEFSESIDTIKEILYFVKSPNITLIFDKGNRNKDIFAELYETDENLYNSDVLKKYHFVSSLSFIEVNELLSIPLCEYKKVELDNKKKLEYISVGKKIYGRKTKVVVVFNKELFTKQNRTYKGNVAYAERTANLLQKKIYKTEKNVFTELRSKIKSSIYSYIDIFPKKVSKGFTYNWQWNDKKIERLEDKLGKTILFTSHLDWDEKEIITSYRTSYKVEKDFKYFNNHIIVPLNPIYHWTDQKIKVHIFCCFIALVIVKLIEFEAKRLDINKEYTALLEELKDIRLCAISKDKKVKFKYETLSQEQMELIQYFNLNNQMRT